VCESEHSVDHKTPFQFPERPNGRFNNWGERKWIAVDPQWTKFVDQEVAKLRLTPRARSLCRSAMLTYSSGVEFVLMSNVHLASSIRFKSGICVVPCFVPMDFASQFPGDERAMAMSKRGLYIYDGWVPNDDWTTDKLERVVSALDDIVCTFSLLGSKWYAYWEPKYRYERPPVDLHQVGLPELRSLSVTIEVLEQLGTDDRLAVSRSVAWISNALKAQSPVQRFLLLFVSIESLVTYIERESDKGSPLQVFAGEKLLKSEKRKARDACIHAILARDLDSNPVKAINAAYFECVVGTRKMLEDHLGRVFGNSKASELMFKEKVEGKTLWQLRNDIAHGSLNVLSEAQFRFVTRCVGSLENIARSYLRKVLSSLAGAEYFSPIRRQGFLIPLSQAVGTPGTEYKGPTDMAERNDCALRAPIVQELRF
jgi:hypothetical protein